MRFDPVVLANDPVRRPAILHVLESAVEAVDPEHSVRKALGVEGGRLRIGDRMVSVPAGPVTILGIGKAAPAMARGAVSALAGLPFRGVVATPVPGPVPDGLEILPGGHPLPNRDSVVAGRRLLEVAGDAGAGDLVLVLVSGGGSACAEAPAPGVGLDDLVAVTESLLASGATIEEINVLRKHLSSLKGGGLAAAAHPARLVTLVLSDVVGNRLESIASGPTVADPSTFADALDIGRDRDLSLPPAVADRLESGAAGGIPDTPASGSVFEGSVVEIVGDAAAAAEGARAGAAEQGIPARVVSTTLVGEARAVGASLAAAGLGLGEPGMLIFAGETTVTVRGPGTGGRNQEAALAAGMALDGNGSVVVAAFGTDGVDGPTPYAGGIADGSLVERGRGVGRDPGEALVANDSSSFLEATGDLLITGPTGTNVGDVLVAYRS
jgi:hydroxypyruvate reductase